MERKTGNQLVCGKRRCSNALQGGESFGRYHVSSSAKLRSETRDFIDPKTAPKPGPWRIVAGPQLSLSQFHCATIPDGPNCQWKGGEFERVEAKNRTALKVVDEAEIEANGQFTEPDWREVVSPDGAQGLVTRFLDQDLDRGKGPVQAQVPLPDDLSVPPFLIVAKDGSAAGKG
jgi:hypothetical protein